VKLLEQRSILGVRVDATSYADASERILEWAKRGESCYVCCAAVNNIMEARRSPDYQAVMDRADLVTSDGMPLVWMLRWLGARSATRVYGPDLMRTLLEAAGHAGIPVGFYGGTAPLLARLVARMRMRFPRLDVVYAEAPPFREPTAEEDRRTTQAMQDAGVRILFVGLGSPKQDRWMHAHKDRVPAVMLGVGAAFDFLAGAKPQAPRWMQSRGLEWMFRLATEPRRLWRRYLTQNPKFVALAVAQLFRART
jgi:N-acetylglucosaminyldiphosphoundecaprenol N-acetyl-beta-D-mannosaminyltransferase